MTETRPRAPGRLLLLIAVAVVDVVVAGATLSAAAAPYRLEPTLQQPPAGPGPPAIVDLPSGFAEFQVASGFRDPTTVTVAPDGRIFVAEQGGTIRIVKDGVLLPTPFLKLPNVDEQGERGLQSIAFDPHFATNHYVYVFYAARDPVIHNRVSRFAANGDVADFFSEVDLLDIEPATSTFHNGGMLRFGSDGDLYIATGDNLTSMNSQDLTNLKGKLLRIEPPDGDIPEDNPFVDKTTGPRKAIWAIGFRNPYTFAFQRGTGRLFVDDVGFNTWEEIDDGVAGGNYGWPRYEGPSTHPRYISPLFAYLHGSGPNQGCAIIGGAFYNPIVRSFPASYVGRYFFADYCNGWIHTLDPAHGNTVADFATNAVRITDVTLDPTTGDLYYLSRPLVHGLSGNLYRITYVGDDLPRIDVQPSDTSVVVGQDATFSVVPTGGQPFVYQWQRNGVDIPGADSDTYTVANAQLSDKGATFGIVVTNLLGTVTSRSATLTVLTDQPPVVTMTSPATNSTYRAGTVIHFAGNATDPEDGVEPAKRFTWTITFHHRDHEHPFLTVTGVKKGSFTVPVSDFETDYVVYFHIRLTVADSQGVVTNVSRDVDPVLSTVHLTTSPAGLLVDLDGTPSPSPVTFIGVVNFQRSIGVASPQTLNGKVWLFDSWSDGGAQDHVIATPSRSTTYTAVFRVLGGSVGTGSGLTGTYYDNSDFTGASFTRIDPTVNFQWGAATSPAPWIGASDYSVRWTGQLQPQFTQTYTLSLRNDEGARVLIDGKTVIDDMTPHPGGKRDTATLSLVAGRRYAIEIDYFNLSGTGLARLSWQSPSTPLSLVPSGQLYRRAA